MAEKKAAEKKAKLKKDGTPRKERKPRGPVTYVDAATVTVVSEELTKLSARLDVVRNSGKKIPESTFDVLDRRVAGLGKTIEKIETTKEKTQRTLEKALERLNANRAERGLPPMSLEDFFKIGS